MGSLTSGPDSDAWLSLAGQRLSSAGLKAGAARTAVIELLAQEGHCLLSPQEIALKLQKGDSGSIASVYRTLDCLNELGLVRRLDGQDGIARYEIQQGDHVHHHFFDEETGEVTPFENEELERLIGKIAEGMGVSLSSHDVILRGVSESR